MKKNRYVRVKTCTYCGRDFVVRGNRKYCSKECAGRASYNRKTKDTLCWDCKKSTGGDDCPLANKFIPVEGWTATPTKIKTYYGYEISFNVRKCPLFIEG